MWWNGSHMFGWGGMPGFGLTPILFWILVLGLAAALIRGIGRSGAAPGRPSGRDLLEERYAKGEIPRDEYLQKKHDLEA